MLRPVKKILKLRNIFIFLGLFTTIYIIKIRSTIETPEYPIPTLHEFTLDSKVLHQNLPKNAKIDWHDHKYIEYELTRTGVGEQGRPAALDPPNKSLEDKLYAVNGFNGALSDRISLSRSLPDIRHEGCLKRKYLASLPTVSVIVPFHNEHWSTLLRTVYSVLNRSPKQLIKEIYLVDDASTKDFLKARLDKYLAEKFEKVKVLRLEKRSGLITARLEGAKKATGDVIIVLDSHTEVNVNWLPPLLEPIAENYKTVVCPFVDVVAYDTFEYRPQDEGARGAFDWEFFYKRLPVLPRDERHMPDPFESPVMAGGLFAMSRKFFWELGGYDPGLDIWGGEQYELSFKTWQCGGRMLDAPCSRVGHIYRKFAPFPNPGHGDFVGKNYRRVAEVWMDEYAQYLYNRRPHYLKIDPGDLTEQKALRKKLNCKPFKWFMTQVAFDLMAIYPPVEPKPYAEGSIRPESDPQLCVDANDGKQLDKVFLKQCGKGEQQFILSWHKDIRSKTRNMCFDVPDSNPQSPILLYSCHLGGGNQLWKYIKGTKQLKHGGNNNCLDWDKKSKKLFINYCKKNLDTQKWNIDKVDYNMLAHWNKMKLRITGPVEKYEGTLD